MSTKQESIPVLKKNAKKALPVAKVYANETLELQGALLFAKKRKQNATLSIVTQEKGETEFLSTTSLIALATEKTLMLDIKGEWDIEIMPVTQAATLFAFLDFYAKGRSQNERSEQNTQDVMSQKETGDYFISLVDERFRKLTDILVCYMLAPESFVIRKLFACIRRMESYWISYFLLSQLLEDKSEDTQKLYNVCKVYGVSESHFRKLCHNVFSCAPKKQLRLWRAAASALQLIENDASVATIAGNNGYASSSHLSSEIKALFDITPRDFKKLEGLLHE